MSCVMRARRPSHWRSPSRGCDSRASKEPWGHTGAAREVTSLSITGHRTFGSGPCAMVRARPISPQPTPSSELHAKAQKYSKLTARAFCCLSFFHCFQSSPFSWHWERGSSYRPGGSSGTAVACRDGMTKPASPGQPRRAGSSLLLCGFRLLRGRCKPPQQGWGGKPGRPLGEPAASRGSRKQLFVGVPSAGRGSS